MKRLIVTADDVALHSAMTEGAILAHREGIVTACSISACGRDLEATAAALRNEPGLDLGVHFTLVEERSILSRSEIPSLVDESGRFPRKWPQFLSRYLTGRIDRGEIEVELRAQLARLRSHGLEIVHANSHQHLHLLPSLRRLVRRVTMQAGIPYVRIVRDRGKQSWTPRAIVIGVLGLSGRSGRGTAAIRQNEATIGVIDAGHLDEDRLVSLLSEVRGVTELVTHPGIGNDEIARTYDWGYDWDRETRALTSPRVRETIDRLGIELIGVRSLV